MVRPKKLKQTVLVTARIELEVYEVMKELAELETIRTGNVTSIQELIRNSVRFMYMDNDRLRETFRKTRERWNATKRKFLKKK